MISDNHMALRKSDLTCKTSYSVSGATADLGSQNQHFVLATHIPKLVPVRFWWHILASFTLDKRNINYTDLKTVGNNKYYKN